MASRPESADRYRAAVLGIKTMRILDRSVSALIPVPPSVAICPDPSCGKMLLIDINEWEIETGLVTEYGFTVECEDFPDCAMFSPYETYDEGLRLNAKIHRWLTENIRIGTDDAEKLARWRVAVEQPFVLPRENL